MFFELTDEQRALHEMATSLLADHAPLERLRARYEGSGGDDRVWPALAEAGILGLGVHEQDGGSGGSEVDAAVVLEAAGHACLPEPLVDTLGVVVPVLRDVGADAALLRDVVAGHRVVGVAIGERRRLDGALTADAALVEVDSRIHLVDRGALELAELGTWDRPRPMAAVQSVASSEATALDVDPGQVRARWWAAHAMALVGTAQRMLDIAVEHARVREQFGSPIGVNQAVAHPLAAVHVDLEAARAGAWHAALAHRDDPGSAAAATRVAVVSAHDAAARADRTSLQVLGGIGFTWEHDLHMVLKHGAATRARLGPVTDHRAAVANDLRAR